MNDLVTIIIPVYNVDKYLERCLDSVLNQTYTKLEIILIDDGSTDKSGEICDQYAQKDNRIIIIHQKNKGVSSARNKGIDIAKGKYLCFVDSDDKLKCEYVEVLVKLITEKKVDMAMVNYVRKYPEYEEKIKYFTDHKMLDKREFFYHLFQANSYQGYLFNKIFKRKMMIDNNLRFDENIHICEDLLLICQLADKCEKFYYDFDKYLYYYYIRKDSALRNNYSIKTATRVDVYPAIIEIFQKNNMDTITIKRDYVYYALVARNELENIEKETKVRYTNIAKKYIGEIFNSRKISWIDKVRLMIMLYFSKLFKFMKKIINMGKNKK